MGMEILKREIVVTKGGAKKNLPDAPTSVLPTSAQKMPPALPASKKGGNQDGENDGCLWVIIIVVLLLLLASAK